MTRETAVTFASLGFLFGLILGLASCSGSETCAQPAVIEVVR